MAEWTLLPRELLESISDLLDSIDTLRFRSVCSAWRTAVPIRSHRRANDVPILPNNGFLGIPCDFTLSKRGVFLISPPPPNLASDSSIEPSLSSYSTGNSNPWLIKTEKIRPGVFHLLHPFSGTHINPLPRDFPDVIDLSNVRVFELGQEHVLRYIERPLRGDIGNLYMEKVAYLLRNGDEFALLTIHVSGRLAIFKSADVEWTIINDLHSPYDDVIVFNGEFYAVDNNGRTVKVNIDSDNALTSVAKPVFGGDKKCLLKLGRELLMIDVHLSSRPEEDPEYGDDETFYNYATDKLFRFKVFKLDTRGQSWVKVDSLGDQILFWGDNCAFSASASIVPGWKGNCICFTDIANHSSTEMDESVKCHDIGIFSFDNEKHDCIRDYPGYCKLFWPPPSWVRTNF